MKEFITIPLNQDKIFRDATEDMGLVIFCIEEKIDANRYEILFESPFDLYYLGQRVVIELNYQTQMKKINEQED